MATRADATASMSVERMVAVGEVVLVSDRGCSRGRCVSPCVFEMSRNEEVLSSLRRRESGCESQKREVKCS